MITFPSEQTHFYCNCSFQVSRATDVAASCLLVFNTFCRLLHNQLNMFYYGPCPDDILEILFSAVKGVKKPSRKDGVLIAHVLTAFGTFVVK